MYGYVNLHNVLKIKTLYTAFSQSFNSNYSTDGEYHNFWEIVIVTEGEIGVTAGMDAFILRKGQAVIHEPMEFHRLWSEGNTCPQIVIFTFAAENMPKLSSQIFEIGNIAEPISILSQIQTSFDIRDCNVKKIKAEDDLGYQIAVKELEFFLLRICMQNVPAVIVKKTQTAKNYASIVTVMENSIDKNLSVSEIAQICNMSVGNLKKVFAMYSGIGVMQYFNRLKIATAINMLKNGMSVQETAAALGFSNQNYFSTVFKRITGCPPTQYKNVYPNKGL